MTRRNWARALALAIFISTGAAAAESAPADPQSGLSISEEHRAAVMAEAKLVSRPPELLSRPPVAYPRSELSSGREGTVTIMAQVLADGSVGHTEVARSSHVAAMDEAALAGVKKWKYRPALDRAGKPVVSHNGEVVSFNPSDAIEPRRIGRIWDDYRRFVRTNEAIFRHCDAVGVDTSRARAALKPTADTARRVLRLEHVLVDELKAAGNPDPKASMQHVGAKLDTYVDASTDKMFAKWSKAQTMTHCKNTLGSMIELGWFYPGSDELLEF